MSLLNLFKSKKDKFAQKPKHSAQDVGDFYNDTTEKFLKVYGDVIQAFRTKNVEDLLDYQIESIGLNEGQIILDAGCGVGGPAIYFAKKMNIDVHGITISSKQVELAEENLIKAKNSLKGKVHFQEGDFNKIPEIFGHEKFDVVYFLESFGHSPNHKLSIESAWSALKPGGVLYIKDLFIREASVEHQEVKIQHEIDKINEGYRYNVADLYLVLQYLRKRGFILQFTKTIDLSLEDFENLDISNQFQEIFGIAQIEDWSTYVFPVDFFEIKCMKPNWNLSENQDKYFLQNMLFMKENAGL